MDEAAAAHSLCSDYFLGVRGRLVGPEYPGDTEVGDLGVHVLVQEDVAGLEIPVDHLVPGVLVQVQEPACDAQDDVEPLGPVQLRGSVLVCSNTSSYISKKNQFECEMLSSSKLEFSG